MPIHADDAAVRPEVVWDQSRQCRWIDFVFPTAHRQQRAELPTALQQLQTDGIVLPAELQEQLAGKTSRPTLHHNDSQCLAITIHGIRLNRHASTHSMLVQHEIELVLGTDYLLTVRDNCLQEQFTHLRDLWQREQPGYLDGPAAFLCYRILKTVVMDYHEVLEEIPARLEKLEECVSDAINAVNLQELQQDIFHLNHALLELRKYFGPLRRVLDRICELAEEPAGVLPISLEHSKIELYDLRMQVEYLIELVDTYRDMMTNVLGAYQSAIANRLAEMSNNMTEFSNVMNRNMQRLTVIATILTTASAITGLYGVNLHGMGLQSESPYGVPLLVLVIVAIGALEFWYFKTRKWV